MIDLTPLDVRKKRGDFRRSLRGYEPDEVDTFLQLVAERMEELVKENLALSEKVDRLQDQVGSLEGRERAVHDALVTAERLRSDVKEQAGREAEVVRREAEADARRILEDAERMVAEHRGALAALERERRQFLGAFRALLERQMERLETEEDSLPEGTGPSAHGRGDSSRRPFAAGGRGAVRGAAVVAGAGAAGAGAAGVEAVDEGSEGDSGAPTPSSLESAAVPGDESPVDAAGEEGAVLQATEAVAPEASEGGLPASGPDQPPGEDLSSWLAGFLEGDDPRNH